MRLPGGCDARPVTAGEGHGGLPETGPVVVDGHEFLVRARPGEPGVYDLDWRTGPPGYGFTSARSDGRPLTRAEVEAAVRDFLRQVDPATGYLD